MEGARKRDGWRARQGRRKRSTCFLAPAPRPPPPFARLQKPTNPDSETHTSNLNGMSDTTTSSGVGRTPNPIRTEKLASFRRNCRGMAIMYKSPCSRSLPILPRLRLPTQLDCDQVRSISSQHCSNLDTFGPTLVSFGPNLADIKLDLAVSASNVGPTWPMSGKLRTNKGQIWPNPGQVWATPCQR